MVEQIKMWKIIALVFLAGYCSCKNDITITYTIENFITGDNRVFNATLILETSPKPFIEIMDEAAAIDYRYRYTTEEHEDFGHYVSSMNGIYESVVLQTYWALLKRHAVGPGQDCIHYVGISTYIPEDGEHVVFQYEGWDLDLPVCPGDQH